MAVVTFSRRKQSCGCFIKTMKSIFRFVLTTFPLLVCGAYGGTLTVPGFTAYLSAEQGARVSERQGVVRWTNPGTQVLWFGNIKTAGELECSVRLRLPEGIDSRLRLTVSGTSHEATAKGSGDSPVTVSLCAVFGVVSTYVAEP